MRIERPGLPFGDVRVRQALMLATDFEAIKNDFYRGQAEIQVYPVTQRYDWLFVPLAQMSQSAQALYKYNPERAKQLLAEAGYPKGFKTKMVVSTLPPAPDVAEIFSYYWAKVGIDVDIQLREPAVYTAMTTGRTWEEMLLGAMWNTRLMNALAFSGIHGPALGWVDPVIKEAYDKVQKNVIVNFPKAYEVYREVQPYIVEQAHVIPRPSPYSYVFWQPWVKNYRGELPQMSFRLILRHMWIDQDLKDKMTGR
jgi:peptide/nickel transport system substrate-binding protein